MKINERGGEVLRRGGVVGGTAPAIVTTRCPKTLATQGQPLPAHQASFAPAAVGSVAFKPSSKAP